jgi:hypothetical protein
MADVVEQGERRGLSRRDLIKASAAAGAAAWTAPVIIDSLASPAAAASGCSGSSVTLSWIWILYTVGGNYYITGFSNGDTACDVGGSNPHGAICDPCGANSFTLGDFSGALVASYTTAGGCGGTQLTDWTQVDAGGGCGAFIGFDNGQIFSRGGATIIAAIGFGAGTLRPLCPNNPNPGNSVCGIEV